MFQPLLIKNWDKKKHLCFKNIFIDKTCRERPWWRGCCRPRCSRLSSTRSGRTTRTPEPGSPLCPVGQIYRLQFLGSNLKVLTLLVPGWVDGAKEGEGDHLKIQRWVQTSQRRIKRENENEKEERKSNLSQWWRKRQPKNLKIGSSKKENIQNQRRRKMNPENSVKKGWKSAIRQRKGQMTFCVNTQKYKWTMNKYECMERYNLSKRDFSNLLMTSTIPGIPWACGGVHRWLDRIRTEKSKRWHRGKIFATPKIERPAAVAVL